jgi:hypothetical protein
MAFHSIDWPVPAFLLPLCVYGLSPEIFAIISKQLGSPQFGYGDFPVIFLIEQIATTVLVLIAAGMRGGRRSDVLDDVQNLSQN